VRAQLSRERLTESSGEQSERSTQNRAVALAGRLRRRDAGAACRGEDGKISGVVVQGSWSGVASRQ